MGSWGATTTIGPSSRPPSRLTRPARCAIALPGGIFVTLAGLKLAFGAIGSALAGTLASFGYTTALLCLSAYVALLLGLVVVDRVVTGRRVTPAAP